MSFDYAYVVSNWNGNGRETSITNSTNSLPMILYAIIGEKSISFQKYTEVVMEIVFDEEEQDDYETEIIDGILTFDELLQDDYYKSEFEKRVQQRLDIQTSHSVVKVGTN